MDALPFRIVCLKSQAYFFLDFSLFLTGSVVKHLLNRKYLLFHIKERAIS